MSENVIVSVKYLKIGYIHDELF